jgi:hypothetical protein
VSFDESTTHHLCSYSTYCLDNEEMALSLKNQKLINIGVAPHDGIFCIGISPHGLISIGAIPHGLISIGLVPMGLFSVGLVSMGILSIGQITMGVVSVGQRNMTIIELNVGEVPPEKQLEHEGMDGHNH